MKNGQVKYPGEIMKAISHRRWYSGNSNYLSMKTISEVLDEAKTEFQNLLDSNYRHLPPTNYEYADFWNELEIMVKKWFGDSK